MIKKPESISDIIFYLVPISMALTYALKYYESVTETKLAGLALMVPALIIASGSAVSLEFVGIKAGHTATDYAEAKDYLRATIAGLMLVSYSAISILSFLGFIPYEVGLVLIVFMAYPLRGMSKAYAKRETAVSDTKATRREDADSARKRALSEQIRQEKREDDRLVRQEKRDQETAVLRIENERQAKADDTKAKERVAVERAKARQVSAGKKRKQERKLDRKVSESSRKVSDKFPTDFRKLAGEDRRYLSELTKEERRAELSHLSARSFHNWNERLDKIPSSNGTS